MREKVGRAVEEDHHVKLLRVAWVDISTSFAFMFCARKPDAMRKLVAIPNTVNASW
jgi:hypothetical protein